MEIRKRNVANGGTENYSKEGKFLEKIQNLDAFHKYPPGLTTSSTSGGGITIITFLLITILTLSEIRNFLESKLLLNFEIDTESFKKIKINIDIQVASRCDQIGIDVIDRSSTSTIQGETDVAELDDWFTPTSKQQAYIGTVGRIKTAFHQNHVAIHHLHWHTLYSALALQYPDSEKLNIPPDACRFRGSYLVPKISGNLHIVSGKAIQFASGAHAHVSFFGGSSPVNFSHRIIHFSFGDNSLKRLNPLDGDEVVFTGQSHHGVGDPNYQYFLKVVPTKIRTRKEHADTYQYAVTELHRRLDHGGGSHGQPGIFLQYDFFPLTVRVVESHDSWAVALINWAAGVGGIFATLGIVKQLLEVICTNSCLRRLLNRGSIPLVHEESRQLSQKVTE